MEKQDTKMNAIHDFDKEASLYSLPLKNTGIGHLMAIVDSILNNPDHKKQEPISVLIAGGQGKRTHARCFLKALGFWLAL